ncbi:MAG: hypothetical protein MHM6MM_000300 [Cercozoa sp. M6MM]
MVEATEVEQALLADDVCTTSVLKLALGADSLSDALELEEFREARRKLVQAEEAIGGKTRAAVTRNFSAICELSASASKEVNRAQALASPLRRFLADISELRMLALVSQAEMKRVQERHQSLAATRQLTQRVLQYSDAVDQLRVEIHELQADSPRSSELVQQFRQETRQTELFCAAMLRVYCAYSVARQKRRRHERLARRLGDMNGTEAKQVFELTSLEFTQLENSFRSFLCETLLAAVARGEALTVSTCIDLLDGVDTAAADRILEQSLALPSSDGIDTFAAQFEQLESPLAALLSQLPDEEMNLRVLRVIWQAVLTAPSVVQALDELTQAAVGDASEMRNGFLKFTQFAFDFVSSVSGNHQVLLEKKTQAVLDEAFPVSLCVRLLVNEALSKLRETTASVDSDTLKSTLHEVASLLRADDSTGSGFAQQQWQRRVDTQRPVLQSARNEAASLVSALAGRMQDLDWNHVARNSIALNDFVRQLSLTEASSVQTALSALRARVYPKVRQECDGALRKLSNLLSLFHMTGRPTPSKPSQGACVIQDVLRQLRDIFDSDCGEVPELLQEAKTALLASSAKINDAEMRLRQRLERSHAGNNDTDAALFEDFDKAKVQLQLDSQLLGLTLQFSTRQSD